MYHAETATRHRVVGVIVWPYSTMNAKEKGCDVNMMREGEVLRLKEDAETKVEYTYNVAWVVGDMFAAG